MFQFMFNMIHIHRMSFDASFIIRFVWNFQGKTELFVMEFEWELIKLFDIIKLKSFHEIELCENSIEKLPASSS